MIQNIHIKNAIIEKSSHVIYILFFVVSWMKIMAHVTNLNCNEYDFLRIISGILYYIGVYQYDSVPILFIQNRKWADVIGQ